MNSSSNGMCEKCRRLFLDEKDEFCDFCGMSVSICTCIPFNMMVNGCIDYRKLIFYRKNEGTAAIRNMMYRIKRSNDVPLMDFFAKELCNIDNFPPSDDLVVTYAPRTKKAVRKYGYDHGKILAEKYAKLGGYHFDKILVRKNGGKQRQQKLLNFKQRAANIKGAFLVRNKEKVNGKTVVIIDDVVTSGATLGECVSLLFEAGAKSVICRSIAYTYRENKQKKIDFEDML
ncbi:MAG: ComF family protein [Clostridia bacterium]|nr:ComF family protein [Clostridia bacterium]